jgi:hypothetical protein
MGLTRINFSNIDTVNANANFKDPTIFLNHEFDGTPTQDSGLVIERGVASNVGLLWDESEDRFVLVYTDDVGKVRGNLAKTGYADLTTGNLTVSGNLTVDGEVTTINSTITNLDDKNILLAAGAPNDAAADGAGITIDGSDATLSYASASDSWNTNKRLIVDTSVTSDDFIGNLTGDVTSGNVTVSDTLRISETGTGLRMTNVGAFDNDGSGNFRVFGTNKLYLRANGDLGSGLEIVESGDVTAQNDFTVDGTLNSSTSSLGTTTISTLANITATTASTSTTTGALRVAGGAGFVGNINVGGQLIAEGLVSADYVTATHATFTGTDAITLPRGTTLQRPSAPVQGMFRYNTEALSFEVYDGTEWGGVSGSGGSEPGGNLYELQYNGGGFLSGTSELTFDGTTLTAGNLTVTGSLTANSTSSDKWSTARALTLTGDVTGSVNIDGSQNVILTATIADDSHSHTIANIDGLSTAIDTAEADAISSANAYTDSAIQNLISASPGTLDTLDELAAALNDDANFATTVTNSIATKLNKSGDTMTGDLVMGGSIIPTTDVAYDLGSPTKMWRDVYVGPGSLYINGQKVLEENSGTITLTADLDQNIRVQTGGAGDIEFYPSATGVIQMKGTMSVLAGKNLTSSDGNAISVAVGLDMNGESIDNLATPTASSSAATKGYVDTGLATKLATTHDMSLTLTGDVTGTATFTNMGNATLTTVVANDSHTHDGRYVNVTGDTITGDLTLNGDLHMDAVGQQITFGQTAGTVGYIRQDVAGQIQIGSDNEIAFYETDSNVEAVLIQTNNKTVTASGGFIGNASSASKWATARTITLGGDLSGSVSLDGSANVTLTAAVADDSHNHTIANIDGLQTALDAKATPSDISTAISNLVDSSPTTLDTLNELAAALGDDPNFATTVTNQIGTKLDASHDMTLTITGDVTGGATFTNMGNATLTATVANDSHTHDGRYYTESESDSRFVNVTGDTMTGPLSFSGSSTHIAMQEGHYVFRRMDVVDEAVSNSSTAYVLLCANAGGNDVNGTITMDRTSGLRHATSCDVLVSAGSSATPVGTCRSMSTAGSGTPNYRLVTLVYSGATYVALEITNPDNYYESSGAYFTGRIKTTIGSNELIFVAPASVSSVSAFGTNESHQINGNKVWHAGNDGSGSGLDADRLDGLQGSDFYRAQFLNGYYGLVTPAGSNSDWVRSTQSGIIPYQSGGHGSLGTSSWPWNNGYINTMTGTSTAARYADLAEKYLADAQYEPGTVVIFGGPEEVTIAKSSANRKAAGIVSTNPAHLMNNDLEGEFVIELGLQGRVPCKVVGKCEKGDLMVSSDVQGHAMAWTSMDNPPYGSILGKALEDKYTEEPGLIEVVVGVR